ncbi:hypothetical protein GCM10009000_040740 [Halobacterium noricense]
MEVHFRNRIEVAAKQEVGGFDPRESDFVSVERSAVSPRIVVALAGVAADYYLVIA